MVKNVTCDILLIGGGITGLWALNRLSKAGYSVLLLEQDALGAGQTIKSQGIIHGGIKYALTGFLNSASQAIATMPKRWQDCLQGQGEIDLQDVDILSHDQLLWSTGGLTSELTTFFASKALKSRVQQVTPSHYPSVLQNQAFKGKVYRLEEVVLNVPSLLRVLAEPYLSSLLKIDKTEGYHIQQSGNDIQTITVSSQKSTFNITAKRYVFCAGEGNAALLELAQSKLSMQRRPLQMVLVKLPRPYPFYGHCLDQGINPRITITTHTNAKGECIWYLGGQIAEDGVHRTPEAQAVAAKQELEGLFPWISWDQAEFKSFFVDRAEGKEVDGKRPDSFCLQPFGNAFACFPTKLALTPLLCDALLAALERDHILPSNTQNTVLASADLEETPNPAKPMWDIVFA